MFVKLISEQELREFERHLEGTITTVKQLSANDENTRNNVVAVVDACTVLQGQIVQQIASYHDAEPPSTPVNME